MSRLLERDHLKSHYRRLNAAKSCLQMNRVPLRKGRCCQSNADISRQSTTAQHTLQLEDKKDNTHCSDVMLTRPAYFTKAKPFTPRLVCKFVQPCAPSKLTSGKNTPFPPASNRTSQQSLDKNNTASADTVENSYYHQDSEDSGSQSISSVGTCEEQNFDFSSWIKQQLVTINS